MKRAKKFKRIAWQPPISGDSPHTIACDVKYARLLQEYADAVKNGEDKDIALAIFQQKLALVSGEVHREMKAAEAAKHPPSRPLNSEDLAMFFEVAFTSLPQLFLMFGVMLFFMLLLMYLPALLIGAVLLFWLWFICWICN